MLANKRLLQMWVDHNRPAHISEDNIYSITRTYDGYQVPGIGIAWVGEAYFDNANDVNELFTAIEAKGLMPMFSNSHVYNYVKEALIEYEFYEWIIVLDEYNAHV